MCVRGRKKNERGNGVNTSQHKNTCWPRVEITPSRSHRQRRASQRGEPRSARPHPETPQRPRLPASLRGRFSTEQCDSLVIDENNMKFPTVSVHTHTPQQERPDGFCGTPSVATLGGMQGQHDGQSANGTTSHRRQNEREGVALAHDENWNTSPQHFRKPVRN